MPANSAVAVSAAVFTSASDAHLDTNFPAHFAGRQDLAGIEQSGWIHQCFDFPLDFQILFRKYQWHQFVLFDADAVLSSNRTAEFSAARHNFLSSLHNSLCLFTVAGVKHQQPMKVSISC